MELTWFKFKISDYMMGTITFCKYSTQGVFNHVQCHYWHRKGNVTLNWLKTHLVDANAEIQELLDKDVIKHDAATDLIRINFMDEMRTEIIEDYNYAKKVGSEGGKKSAKLRGQNRDNQDNEGGVNTPSTNKDKNRLDKNRLDKNIQVPTEQEFLAHCQEKIGKDKFLTIQFSLQSKYNTWKDDGWKDGHGTKIKNWKNKILNTIPFLKPMHNTGSAAGDGTGKVDKLIQTSRNLDDRIDELTS